MILVIWEVHEKLTSNDQEQMLSSTESKSLTKHKNNEKVPDKMGA